MFEKTTHNDQLYCRFSTRSENCVAKRLGGIVIAALDDARGDVRVTGKLQAGGRGIAGDHDADLGAQLPVLDAFEEISQRRSTAGNQYGKGKRAVRFGSHRRTLRFPRGTIPNRRLRLASSHLHVQLDVLPANLKLRWRYAGKRVVDHIQRQCFPHEVFPVFAVGQLQFR